MENLIAQLEDRMDKRQIALKLLEKKLKRFGPFFELQRKSVFMDPQNLS